MAIPDIPVFPFRVNWREPLEENISFLTNVLRSREGNEQRRKLRQTPRRSFDIDLLLTRNERTFFDLFVHDLGEQDMLCPLYWDVVTLMAPLAAGVTDRIDFDTTLRDWAYQEGGAALIMRKDALTYEVVEIANVDAGGVDLTDPVAAAWPRGSIILPLRRAKLDGIGEISSATAGVATLSARVILKEPNHWTPATDESPLYGGLPVLLTEPNWVEGLLVNMEREIASLDNQTGVTFEKFPLNRIMLGQQHRWFLPGKERLAEFRDLIYRHSGRAGAFWLPTFKADLQLAEAAGSGATEIEVENVGFGLTGGPKNGREHIAIKHGSGTICRKILSVSPGSTDATETLELDGALGLALSPGQVRRISFLDTARFDSDEFTISHYGGIEAHHESSALFRTFRNTRVPPTILIAATPEGVMSDTTCGTPAEDSCPPPEEFDGWDYEMSAEVQYELGSGAITNFFMHRPIEFGGALNGGNNYGGAIGSDFSTLFAHNTAGKVKWGARRINVKNAHPLTYADMSMLGMWHVQAAIGIVNFFGQNPLNHITIKFYWRHWTIPFKDKILVRTISNKTGNNDEVAEVPVDIDWREYRNDL